MGKPSTWRSKADVFNQRKWEVREMRRAETILEIIHERGKRGLPLEQVYRQLFNPELFVRAYGKIAQNRGALTPGSTDETADAMTMGRINAIIDDLRYERYRWTPARRVYIPKSNGKTRPLGVTAWRDKLLQEVLRAILESYYEPQFSSHSHGFRPGRGCHTALEEIQAEWPGTTWFVEGDVVQCFDRLDHQVLIDILSEQIHDGRFIRLISNLLKAGYLEDWRYNQTLSGTPQGGIVSPVLMNIYLDRLDQFVEQTLIPEYSRGKGRKTNPAYQHLNWKAMILRKKGRYAEAEETRKQFQKLPSKDPNDPNYRRLRYVRYADDVLLGFAGPYAEAEEIKRKLATFLNDNLKLELSETKTLITHARTESARFLGYDISLFQCNQKRSVTRRRSINGRIYLRVPAEVLHKKCQRYKQGEKSINNSKRQLDSPFTIVASYQNEYRGFVEYYRRAHNLGVLDELCWVMGSSLLKTLAAKFRLTVNQVVKKYQAIIQTPNGPRKGLQVIVERGENKKPLVARWGGISLKRESHAVLNDHPTRIWSTGTELVQRLLADTCELCGSHENVEVHHIRALKSLQPFAKQGDRKPEWVKLMVARQRKTLMVCRKCHEDIHAGRDPRKAKHESKTSESRVN